MKSSPPMQVRPDFENFLATLRREATGRPVLFEFLLHPVTALGEPQLPDGAGGQLEQYFRSFLENGYDFVPFNTHMIQGPSFPRGRHPSAETYSLNEGGQISDEASFEAYDWPDPDAAAYDRIPELAARLPEGCKFVAMWPGGVLENMMGRLGFDALCYLLADEPELVARVADAVGSRLHRFYERLLEYDCIGALIQNDDWGFKTQTMLSPAQMRTCVFPWHRKTAEMVHAAGRPVILHSCGNMSQVWEDIIDGMGFDAKHSFEDTILPVEEAYEQFGDRIAILGGLDVDFLCRSSPEAVYLRANEMLERTQTRGGYALGSGNSITSYMPRENFLAMTRAVRERQVRHSGG